MKKIYFIRHGETESNRQGIFRGTLDMPLSKNGLEQAGDLHRYFSLIPIDIVYSSPLQRAVRTAEIAFPTLSPVIDRLVDNLNLGDWSGKEKKKMQEEFPQEWQRWIEEPEKMVFPGGEGLSDVYARVEKFLEKLTGLEQENIAVVSHRSVIKVMLAAMTGLKDRYFWKFHLDNASVCLAFYTGELGFTLAKVNETHHLKEMVMEWY